MLFVSLAAIFLLLILLQSEWWAQARNQRGEFKSDNCYLPSDDLAALTFRSDEGHRRSISFSKVGRFSIVYLGYGSEISVDWDHILSVHIGRYARDPKYVSLTVQFDEYPEISPSLFLFGLAPNSCVDKLVQRYGSSLKFVRS